MEIERDSTLWRCLTGANVLLVAAVLACSDSSEPAPLATAQPKWMREEPKKIEPSQEVKKLMADDPDVTKQLTPEEIKATLAAVQSKPLPVSTLGEIRAVASDGKWQQMENDQKARNQGYRDRLAQTGVYVAPGDEYYHAIGCGSLYVYSIVNMVNGERRRQYVGSVITLAAAKDHGMKRHAECGAPSYEFSQ